MAECKTALFVQARLDSSRLPGKSILPLGDMTVLDVVLRNLCGCADVHALLCPQDCIETFQPIAQQWGYELISGPKEDVLARFNLALDRIQTEWIIRATADNTVVSADLARQLLHDCQEQQADYACFTQTPYGIGVEVIRAEVLKIAAQEARTVEEREHVCPFITKNTDRFIVYYPPAPAKWQAPQLRATLDTYEDYEYLQKFHRYMDGRNFEIVEEFVTWAKVL